MDQPLWSPRIIADAAIYLDEYGGPDGSAEFAPLGLDSMSEEQCRALVAHAIALGFGFVVRGE